MRANKLTSRERVDRFLRRLPHDSVPRAESLWGETYQRFRDEGMGVDIHEWLGQDFMGLCWADPKPYPLRRLVVAEDDETVTYRDEWDNTVRYWKRRAGTPEHVAFGCDTREQWFDVFKPAMLAAAPFVNPTASLKQAAEGRRRGLWMHLTGLEPFEMTRRQVGDEITLMAMIEDPEWVRDVSATMTDLVIADFNLLEQAGVEFDGVWIYGDMAYKNGPMCSPAHYRELIWPEHKKLADWAHERGKPFIYHTDGDVNSVLDLYLEAGFDALQPLEAKAGMDVRTLAPAYGDRLSLFGNIDVMIMATNDLERIEHEVVSKMRAGMERNGYAYHSDHSVPPSVSWDTYQFIIDLVDRYGNYD